VEVHRAILPGESRLKRGGVMGHGALMTAFVSHTSIDCRNAYELSEWWKQVLGYVDVADDPNLPGHEECMILDPETGHRLLFIEVPEDKSVKNRLTWTCARGPAGGTTSWCPSSRWVRPRSPTSAASTGPAPVGSSSRTPRATSSAS
jgi:hypothetical protein